MLAADPPALAPSGAVDRVRAASAAVRRYCGWHIAPVVQQTFTVDGPGGKVLALPTLRLIDVLAVSQDGVAFTTDELTALEWSHDGYLRTSGWWTTRLRGVEVTIEHGFDSTPDLDALIADIASRVTAGTVRRKTMGNRSVEYVEPGLMQHEMDQLARYRLPGLL